ncbi:MAG: hypothetical protein IPJ25_01760 [Rhodocyclaceae bacterium]|nr:hypothetical protein [Rhodocyclaceae bacterium]
MTTNLPRIPVILQTMLLLTSANMLMTFAQFVLVWSRLQRISYQIANS